LDNKVFDIIDARCNQEKKNMYLHFYTVMEMQTQLNTTYL